MSFLFEIFLFEIFLLILLIGNRERERGTKRYVYNDRI